MTTDLISKLYETVLHSAEVPLWNVRDYQVDRLHSRTEGVGDAQASLESYVILKPCT